jgi:hypothetical protein
MDEEAKICDITHPIYDEMIPYWEKFRLTFRGGAEFIDKFLVQYSKREDVADFKERKTLTYCPAHAKAAVTEIKNAIYQRMCDIKRLGGPDTYKKAVAGEGSGVDLAGNTMTSFIGRLVLPDLLSVGKVGVFIDKPYFDKGLTISQTKNIKPYLYIYHAEDIRSWAYDDQNQLQIVLLMNHGYIYDENGLPVDEEESYRLLIKTINGILVKFYDKDGTYRNEYVLNLREIPFVIFEITNSLLTDVADYQVALLNLASSDMSYATKSNYPFYTEQYNPLTDMTHLRQATPKTTVLESGTQVTGYAGNADEAAEANQHEVRIGVSQGRRYPVGTDRPQFIHPSSEPLRASMEKQDGLKEEIRQLVNLSVTTIEPKRASAESKVEDRRTLEAGLSYIGLELEYGERQIGNIWCMYEGHKNTIDVKYPEQYSLLTEAERRIEAKQLKEIQTSVPSDTYRRHIAKEIVEITVGHKVNNEELTTIKKEIDDAVVVISDADTIINDHEAGLVSDETASIARGYPKTEVSQARIDHTDRLARIAEAQSKFKVSGVQDLSDNPKDSKNQKVIDSGKV